MISILDIPGELVDCILLYLDLRGVAACYMANSHFHVVSGNRLNRLRYRDTNIYTLIRNKSLNGIKYKVETMGVFINDSLFRFTIILNCPEIVDYLAKNSFTIKNHHLNCGITCKHIDLVESLLKKWNLKFDVYSPFTAVRHCSVVDLERLSELGLKYNNDCVDLAIKHRDYKIVKYFYDRGLRASTLIGGARRGNIKIIKLLLHHNAPNIDTALNLAARRGHLDVIKLLHIAGGRGTHFAIHQAACYNSLEIVRYLHFIGTPTVMFTTFNFALKGSSLKLCKQLVAMGLYCGRRGINEVARRGNTEVLQYIHERQRPYYHATELNPLDYAATFGRIESVRYLVTLGYPVHGSTFQQVIRSGNMEIRELIIERNYFS